MSSPVTTLVDGRKINGLSWGSPSPLKVEWNKPVYLLGSHLPGPEKEWRWHFKNPAWFCVDVFPDLKLGFSSNRHASFQGSKSASSPGPQPPPGRRQSTTGGGLPWHPTTWGRQFPYHPWDERYVYLHEWLILYVINLGKYTSHMDAMGLDNSLQFRCPFLNLYNPLSFIITFSRFDIILSYPSWSRLIFYHPFWSFTTPLKFHLDTENDDS